MSSLKAKDIFKVIKTRPEIFIETGTYRGETTAWAAGLFRDVHTIEISEELYEGAKARLSVYDNVKLYLGDSVDVLPNILNRLEGCRAFFWLDAHFSGKDSGRGAQSVPLLQELEIIGAYGKDKDHIIVIDDYRLFGWKDPTGREDWSGVTEESVRAKLRSINSKYWCFSYSDTYIGATRDNLRVVNVCREILYKKLRDLAGGWETVGRCPNIRAKGGGLSSGSPSDPNQ